MKSLIPLLLGLILIVSGCSGSSGGLIVGKITGPDEFHFGETISFSVEVNGVGPFTYFWAVEPHTAGIFSSPQERTTEFKSEAGQIKPIEATISLVVSSDDGGPVVRSFKITISPAPEEEPVAAASVNTNSARVYQGVRFDGSGSYDPDGGAIVSYEWDWDGDLTFEGSGEFAIHDWEVAGIYEVRLRVTDDEGQTMISDPPILITVEAYPEGGWVRQLGSRGWDKVMDIEIQSDGTIVIAGVVWAYHPGSSHQNFLLAAYNPDGTLKWLNDWGTTDDQEYLIGVAIDDSDNIYVIGEFTNEVDIDPGPAQVMINSSYGGLVVIKFDSSGNYVWHYQYYGHLSHIPRGIDLDSEGNIYFCGVYNFYMIFPNVLTGISTEIRSSMGNIYIAKLDNNGNFINVAPLGGSGYFYCTGFEVDNESQILIAGYGGGTIDFDPHPDKELTRTTAGSHDCILAAYDTDINPQWANVWGGADFDRILSLAVNDSGELYCLGYYTGNIDADPGPNVVEVPENPNDPTSPTSFLSKFTSSGEFKWIETWPNKDHWPERFVSVDSDDRVLINFHTVHSYDFFRLTGDGTQLWQITHLFTEYDEMEAIRHTHGRDGYMYVTGIFDGLVDLNFGPNEDWHESRDNNYDIFIARWNQNGYPE